MGWKRKKSEGVQVMKGGKRMGNLMDIGKIPSLKRLVYDNLKERIISGELKPGTRLREEDLSVEMNISRAPIREAFNMLERDGFTVIVPRKGAVVAEATEEEMRKLYGYLSRKGFRYDDIRQVIQNNDENA